MSDDEPTWAEGPASPDEPQRRRGGRRRHRRTRRARTILIVFAAFIALIAVTGGGVYYYLDSHIQVIPNIGLLPPKDRPKDTPATDILLIGTDARGGENTKLGGPGDAVGRSDTTILVHVYPGAHSAAAVSIPRDSLVNIPRCRLADGSWSAPQTDVMFNSAFSVGGTTQGNPDCTVNTVEKMTHIHIDHVIVANFAGFAAMSKAVGGVPVCLPNDVYQGDLDPNLGYEGKLIFKAGRQLVSGDKALEYVRVRHGIGDGSDIGRIKRQQAFLASLVMTMKARGLEPSHIFPLVQSAMKTLSFDSGLDTPLKLLSFAKGLVHLNPKNIDFVTVPWVYDGPRVSIVEPDANELWSALRHNVPLSGHKKSKKLPRGSGTVDVENGTVSNGLAGTVATKLTKAGFTATATNAAVRNHVSSQIRYAPADAARAKLLARYLDAQLVPDSSAKTLTIVLGTSHKWLATSSSRKLPSSVTQNIRKATANVCSDLTQG